MDNVKQTQEITKETWWKEKGEEMLETGQYSDIQIVVEYLNEPIQRIRAHKCLLHLTSPVWSSAVRWAMNDEIKITDYPYNVILALIKCAYINTLQIQSMNECLDIIRAADYYDMKTPVEICNEFVQQYICKGDVAVKDIVQFLNIAVLLKLGTIKAYCIAYIEDNTNKFFDSEYFLTASLEVVLTLTRIQNYLCSEEYLIRSVLKWCEANREHKTIKEFVQSIGIVDLFRWQTLSPGERSTLINDYPDVFQGEISCNLDYNPEIAANESRGEPNELKSFCIIVRGPPLMIAEQFTYYGEPTVLPIASIQLAPRRSVIDHTVTKTYEDKFTITIFDRTIDFDGPVSDASGPVVTIPSPILMVPLSNESSFIVTITLRKTGVYYKNTNFFEHGRGLFRYKEGIIEKINSSYEESGTEAGPSHDVR